MPARQSNDLHVMGGRARVVTLGGPAGDVLFAAARRRLLDLEARWTRFDPGSELRRLNARPERPVVVSEETYLLVERAVAGWHATDGLFDPTVFDAVAAAGYDRSFETLGEHVTIGAGAPTPGCGSIALDAVVRAVTLPGGVRLDAGGIGKGLAADLVVEELLGAGAAGALVEVGGDLRAGGEAPSEQGWEIGVEDPHGAAGEAARLGLSAGGVATSSVAWRHWRDAAGRSAHHIVDPGTGRSAGGGLVAATVVASRAWWAEVYAKAAFVAGADAARALLEAAGLTALLMTEADTIVTLGRVGEVAA